MRSLDEINEAIEQDSKIDKSKLEHELLNTSVLYNKYLKWLYEYNVVMGACDTKLHKIMRDKMLYYQGKGSADEYRKKPFNDVITNQKYLERYILADSDVCAVTERIEEIKSIRQMLQDMLDSLKYRNKTIEAILTHRRFEAGA